MTPLGIIAGLLGPPTLSRTLSWPMMVGLWLDTPRASVPPAGAVVFEGPAPGLPGVGLGVALTWLSYVLFVRLILWRVAVARAEGRDNRRAPA